jgi:acetyl-CoA carboxylase biotin carboxyl carrier protein
VDIADLKEILRILDAQDITEFELEQDGVKLRICRSSRTSAAVGGVPSPPAGPATSAPAAGPLTAAGSVPATAGTATLGVDTEGGEGPSGTLVNSPIVGTFYRAPDPNSPPFVNVGDRVKVGQVLCIIEAMKLMNEIEAELAGEVLKIHVENGQPVQYGDPLFTVRPV